MSSSIFVKPILVLFLVFFTSTGYSKAESIRLALSDAGAIGLIPIDDRMSTQGGDRKLYIGVLANDNPPYSMIRPGRGYEGIASDMIQIVASALLLEPVIRVYPDAVTAKQALTEKKIDAISVQGWLPPKEDGFSYSKKYVSSQVAVFRRINDSRNMAVDYRGVKIGFPEDLYNARNGLEGISLSDPAIYSTNERALAALSFGEVDVAVGELISTNSLINSSYFNYVKVDKVLSGEGYGAAFVINKEHVGFLKAIDEVISSVNSDVREGIIKRWSGGIGFLKVLNIKLTESEKEWVSRTSSIRFLVSGDQAPVAFIDKDQNFSGVAADVMKLFTLRTGIRVDAGSANKLNDLLVEVRGDGADIVVLSESEERKKEILFTREFLKKPFALVSRSEDPLGCRLNQGVIAMPKGHVLLSYLNSVSQKNRIKNSYTFNEALELVRSGQADCAIAAISVVQYYLARQDGDDLKIAGVLDYVPASFAFGISKRNVELQSILDKILAVIPPDELNIVATRWRSNSAERVKTWYDYRAIIIEFTLLAAVLLSLAFIWVQYLKRQIVHRKKAEQELGDKLAFIRDMLDSIPHPVYFCDAQGELAGYNASFAVFLISARVSGDIDIPGELSLLNKLFREFLEYQLSGDSLLSGAEGDKEIKYKGTFYTLYHWARPYTTAGGNIKGTICGWIDVTDKQELIKEMAFAKEQAMSANKAKTTFLATMSHEIRTPLNAVIGMLELVIARYELGEFYIDGVKIAFSSASELLDLIGDVLDMSRIESGRIEISRQPANLVKVASSVVNVFSGLAKQKGLLLAFEADEKLNDEYLFDSVRVRQVISNLVGNAIKFTDQGGVSLHLRVADIEGGELLALIEVRDTGVGISDIDLERIFEPFVQGAQADKRAGTGLGLKICNVLCEMMGGDLKILSREGGGVVAIAKLPLVEAKRNYQESVDRVRLDEHVSINDDVKKILLVDDHPANRLLLSQQLSFLGHQVVEAGDGAQALELCSSHSFDMVITDCQMPIMDGYKLTEQIRLSERQRTEGKVPIIGYTANAQIEERERCLKIGMNECLFKPITLGELKRVIAGYSSSASRDAAVVFSYDLGEVRKIAGEDAALTRLLLTELFKSNYEDSLAMKEALASGDLVEISSIAHRIKGGMKLVSAGKIVAKCEKIERLSSLAISSELEASINKLVSMLAEFEQIMSADVLGK
ncbi:MAG: transporter substrate-binding domain-containing protein [Kaiparowitsia implicata GSE-PSE-MK54-09C]|nr:transporter substrate-binding domain-containing protein [Kaiparowitsia implicata GSE-PSE-MK54-09C]